MKGIRQGLIAATRAGALRCTQQSSAIVRSAAPMRSLSYYASKGPKGPVQEPPRGVHDEDDEVPASEVRVPYVPEETRAEIYAKFKQDPRDRSFYKLASEYRMTTTRMKAIVYLMRSREEMMIANGVNNISEEENDIYTLYKQGVERSEELKRLKEQLAARKVEEEKASKKKKKPLPNHEDAEPTADDEGSPAVTAPEGAQLTLEERIASAESMTDYTAETIAAEMHLDVSKVKDVIRRLSDHYMRMQNVQGFQAQQEDLMAVFRDSGVNTNFSETSSETDANFDKDYWPRLINDHEFEEEAKALRVKLLLKTRAAYDPKVEHLLNKKYEANSVVSTAAIPNNAGVTTDKFLRSKLAFLDTSNKETLKGATLVRKRDGSQRVATPMEEMKRSWGGKQPNYLEIALHQKLLDMQLDPDNDDKKARNFVTARYEARKKVLSEAKK